MFVLNVVSLISKENTTCTNMYIEDRWRLCISIASKIKRCGEDTEMAVDANNLKNIKEGLATLFAEWEIMVTRVKTGKKM